MARALFSCQMIAALLAVFLTVSAHAKKAPLLGDGTETLITAEDGVSIAEAARDSLWLCPRSGTLPDGTVVQSPDFLVKPNSAWVDGVVIDISAIPTVPGNVVMKHKFRHTKTDTTRRLKGNGIPNHPMGTFPIVPGSEAYDIYSSLPVEGYPNAAAIPVAPYNLDVTLPRFPELADEPSCVGDIMIGVSTQTGGAWHVEFAIDAGYSAVDPNAALPTDLCWGHPYLEQYHYHGYSWKCFPRQGKEGEHSPLFGYAMDGFGIYGPRSEGGELVKNSDLDECHGHIHEIKWEGKKVEMYQYHQNNEYPYSIGCFRGTPVPIRTDVGGQVTDNTRFEKTENNN